MYGQEFEIIPTSQLSQNQYWEKLVSKWFDFNWILNERENRSAPKMNRFLIFGNVWLAYSVNPADY
jgi:hypothetical protein